MFQIAEWIKARTVARRYAAAVLLAIAAQVARIPVQPPKAIPITYAPFIVLSALGLGLWPGLVTTILCALELVYFGIEPIGSLAVADPMDWERVAVLVVTGLVAGIMAERLKRSQQRLAEAHRRISAVLESISDGFNTFDHEWRYTYVNAAAARMVGK
jgi:K+-sensing histidine kinase KdpD